MQLSSAMPRTDGQQQINDPNTLIKVIILVGKPACTRKRVLFEDARYLTDIGAFPAVRQRGFAGAVMLALHRTARAMGAANAILNATEMAGPLYRSLAYQQIGTLDIYERRES